MTQDTTFYALLKFEEKGGKTISRLGDLLLRLALKRLLVLLGRLLGQLLLAGNAGLDADAAKDETDAQDLHLAELVAKRHDGQDHGEHFARDCHRHEEDRGKGGQGID